MDYAVLTQYSGKLLGPIAKYILGPILNAIFVVLDKLPWNNSANVGVAIIIFTIVIYLLLLPLTIKQQKFSKLQAKMQPEIQAIQAKYKDKKDQNSQMAMNQETQAVYKKYGVSPTGSCVQLAIQMPILFALYRVIYSIPAYVPMVKSSFTDLVSELVKKDGATELLQGFKQASMYSKQFSNEAFTSGNVEYISNTYIDVLNKATKADWASISEKFPDLSNLVSSTMEKIGNYNNFLGINMGYSPSEIVKQAISDHSYFLVFGVILIPILSAVTQWINVKLTPQAANNNTGNDQANQMAQSMKAMNTFMPIFSAVMCFTLPSGLGIYWIAGAVVRSVEQVLINKHIDKMDLDAEIKKNVEKREARLKKAGIDPNKLTQNAYASTKSKPSISTKASYNNTSKEKELDVKVEVSNDKKDTKPGSIAAKANMVRDYNERNNK